MIGVRFREELEGRCDACGEYWPITSEFWRLDEALRRCRACRQNMLPVTANNRLRASRHYMIYSRDRYQKAQETWNKKRAARRAAGAA